jgi:hypothetical protein
LKTLKSYKEKIDPKDIYNFAGNSKGGPLTGVPKLNMKNLLLDEQGMANI